MKRAGTDLARALRAVRVVDGTTSVIGGRPFPHRDVAGLAHLVYSELYVRPRRAPSAPAEQGFVAALSEANRSATGWEADWTLVAHERGRLVAERGGLRVYCNPGEVVGADRVGAKVHVRVGKENRAISPGYYFFFGETLDTRDPAVPHTVRVYFNLDALAATAFVDGVTSSFNRARLPFVAKVAASPSGFCRADAAVIYLDPETYLLAKPLLRSLRASLGRRVHSLTPLFTKPVAPGVGLAEEPGTGDSFGEHRSRAVAVAVTRAFAENVRAQDARLELALGVFRESGIDPERPHLSLGHRDVYEAWS